ncbi:MAG: hypothetical protein K6U14_10620 [Firmicutes bacterium]|nr:hypothetical protein [Alicyclobacillaceae bacterium]MCL6498064.1 hypothetical protein [Bacillota bacterium]
MAERPSPGVLAPEDLPPVKAAVEIEWQPGPEMPVERYQSRIILRDGGYDYLDALRTAAGEVVAGWTLVGRPLNLLWGRENYLYRYPITVEEVLEPLPALRVTYLGLPRRHNRRREWRSNTKVVGQIRLAEVTDQDRRGRPMQTVSRNISYSAVRFFSRFRLEPGTVLETEWRLAPGEVLRATMRVLRTVPGPSQYQGWEGVDVVALWDPPLSSPAREQWKAFCDRHRWD